MKAGMNIMPLEGHANFSNGSYTRAT